MIPTNCDDSWTPKMEFAFLTSPEIEGASIRWDDTPPPKSQEFVAAALAAGFSEWEVQESPIGVLEEDFMAGPGWAFRRGACALIGMNGCVLLQVERADTRS